MKTLHGKVVAITGAGSGIGRETAIAMAKLGASLAISDVNTQGLAETQAQCQQLGVRCVSTELDVANREAVYAWAQATRDSFGEVNVIINNAGVSLGSTVADMRYEDFEQ